jgi:hypothetical protein
VADLLEWFQCKSCGRRFRWSADIAGTQIRCNCGTPVSCPELDGFSDASASAGGTVIETVDSPTAMSPGDSVLGEQFELPDSGETAERVAIKHKNTGAFGLTTNGQCLMWFILSLIAIGLIIHAVITTFWWYITAAAIFAPIAFIKFHFVSRRWRRNRSWMTALKHTLEEMS